MLKKYDKIGIIIFVFSDTDTTLKSVKKNYGTNKNKIQASLLVAMMRGGACTALNLNV